MKADSAQLAQPDEALERRAIDTIRTLAMDAVQKANSGHPGTPMAMAPVAYTLWRDFVRYDPAPALRAVRCPVLVLQGDLDLQVLPDQNLPAIRSALEDNDRVSVVQFPGLNHLFQTAKTGLPAEYSSIEQTLAPEVLATMSDWLTNVVTP